MRERLIRRDLPSINQISKKQKNQSANVSNGHSPAPSIQLPSKPPFEFYSARPFPLLNQESSKYAPRKRNGSIGNERDYSFQGKEEGEPLSGTRSHNNSYNNSKTSKLGQEIKPKVGPALARRIISFRQPDISKPTSNAYNLISNHIAKSKSISSQSKGSLQARMVRMMSPRTLPLIILRTTLFRSNSIRRATEVRKCQTPASSSNHATLINPKLELARKLLEKFRIHRRKLPSRERLTKTQEAAREQAWLLLRQPRPIIQAQRLPNL
jgi:hypothetical protein